ncbi:MAG: hypothetical protein AAFU85_27880, partial [Planctomycetota bacterium]
MDSDGSRCDDADFVSFFAGETLSGQKLKEIESMVEDENSRLWQVANALRDPDFSNEENTVDQAPRLSRSRVFLSRWQFGIAASLMMLIGAYWFLFGGIGGVQASSLSVFKRVDEEIRLT